ncbi:TonB-dependent receptor [Oligoflexia bacterium]|nr:TonB-dependent receptor [Oligoflexia bacterium]
MNRFSCLVHWHCSALLFLSVSIGTAQLLSPPVTQAETEEAAVDDISYLDLSLEELLNVTTEVVSKETETIAAAPAIVTTLTIKDIQRLGVRTLKGALSLVPGLVVQETHLGTTSLLIRGISETFNQKVLFLLNGVPFWMSSHGDIPLLGIPLDAVDRIEMIRGPGSVIYGTNASAGVINVILKEKGPHQVQAHGGSQGLFNTSFFTHQDISDDGYIVTGGSFQNMSRGYNATFPETVLIAPFSDGVDTNGQAFPTSGTIKKKEESQSAYIAGKIKDSNFLVSYFRSLQNGLGGAPVIMQDNEYIQEGLLLHGDHTFKHKDLSLNLFADHNIDFLELRINNFLTSTSADGDDTVVTSSRGRQLYTNPWGQNWRFRFGAHGRYPVLENVNLLFGVENENRHTGEYRKTDDDENLLAKQSSKNEVREQSVFSNFDMSFDPFRVVLGARFIDNEFAGSHIAPRAAVVYSLSSEQSIKLALAEGFNSPVLSQLDLTIPFVVNGNPDLEAERVRTVDLAYTYNASSTLFVLNGYYLDTKDLIERDAETLTYENSGNYDRFGVEVDLQKTIGSSVRILTNFAYNLEGNDDTIADDPRAQYVPQTTANLGAYYHFIDRHSIGVVEQFIGERQGIDSQSITSLNLTLQFDFMEAFVTAFNIFDEEIQSPDINNNGRIPIIPAGPGTSFYTGVRFKF